ncbi:MAG: hypothetical protein LKI53_02455 [Bacteroidales bacterium]|nr:hypothetical protein [Bacteroidales bacterium]
MEQPQPICGNCISCYQTYQGSFCNLTDNAVDYYQPGCIDHIPVDDPNYGE